MKRAVWFVIGAVCGVVVAMGPRIAGHLHGALHGGHGGEEMGGARREHTEEKFSFMARGPIEAVAPLFGAEKEKAWSPGWEPKFVYPMPAVDKAGMVFTVAHSHLQAVWVNTEFDLKNGRVQYVYVIPEAMVTVITLKLTPAGDETRVEVEYDRTALSAQADAHVRRMAEGDRGSGPEWEKQVNGVLRKVISNQ